MTVDKEVQDIEKATKAVKHSLIEKILALPDNPRIEHKSENPKCFTINSSNVRNWSVENHDFKKQHEQLALIVNKVDIMKLISTLQNIIKTGRHRDISFHPDVIEQLRKLIEIS